MQRIFVALDISDNARQSVSSYIANLRDAFPGLRVGWEKSEKLHLTLKFLGEIDAIQLDNLTEAIGITARKISTFKMRITETGVFPSPRKARVLWLGLKDETGNLQDLNLTLESESEKLGFAREKRNFKPHLTIARLREPLRAEKLVEKHLSENFEPLEFEVSEIVIYQSRLLPQGSIYRTCLQLGDSPQN